MSSKICGLHVKNNNDKSIQHKLVFRNVIKTNLQANK